jgi:hypothetical protein
MIRIDNFQESDCLLMSGQAKEGAQSLDSIGGSGGYSDGWESGLAPLSAPLCPTTRTLPADTRTPISPAPCIQNDRLTSCIPVENLLSQQFETISN